MVICDAIWIDPGHGKATLLGVFDEIGAREFPAPHHFAVYISTTDAQGLVPIKVQVVDIDEESEPLFKVENVLEFPDRRAIINISVEIKDIAFPSPGEYSLQLFGHGEFMTERRLVVRQE
jgi:hypothetical protein